MRLIVYLLFGIGGFLCLLNFYLSFLRYPLFQLNGKAREFRWLSGIPLLGSALVVLSLLILQEPTWLIALGIGLAAVDTGGLHWFIVTMIVMSIQDRSTRN